MAKLYNVAVVGATGLVGHEFLKIAAERHFPINELRLLASSRSAGKRILYGGDEVEVEETTPNSFRGVDLAFFSASSDVSRDLVPHAVDAGSVAIDDSKAWRMEPHVPLVVPEVNGADVEEHRGVLSIPNCTTTPLALTLWPLHQRNPIKRITVSTYQAVSGTGGRAVEELTDQVRAVVDGKKTVGHVYPHQIGFNVLPQVEVFLGSGYTKEEWGMISETRKIMHAPELAISATCVRVPVLVGHSLAVHVEFSEEIGTEEVQGILREASGLTVQDEPSVGLYPMPREAAGKDDVFVGRIRQDASHPEGIALWIVCDNLRKGAALNAIQIAEELVARSAI